MRAREGRPAGLVVDVAVGVAVGAQQQGQQVDRVLYMIG